MSVLIKGMNMPQNCKKCHFCDYEQANCLATKYERNTLPHNESRPEWCPLIEVPPHGRLIDADELIEDLVSNDPVVIAAKCAPTIIDAEEGEKNG